SRYAPVRARLVTKPYRRILKTSGYAGGYLLSRKILLQNSSTKQLLFYSLNLPIFPTIIMIFIGHRLTLMA
ncbi:hypothetical protein, partial [Providencia huaxiensis]